METILIAVGIIVTPYIVSYMVARGWRNGKGELRNIWQII